MLIEDRVDIDSEYFVTKRTHECVLVFAQEPREDEDGTAFKAVEDPAPGLHGDPAPGLQWDDAPGYLDPRTLNLSSGR